MVEAHPAISTDSQSYPVIAAALATGVPMDACHEIAWMLLRDMRGGDHDMLHEEPHYERAMTRALAAAGSHGVTQFIRLLGRHFNETRIGWRRPPMHQRRPGAFLAKLTS